MKVKTFHKCLGLEYFINIWEPEYFINIRTWGQIGVRMVYKYIAV